MMSKLVLRVIGATVLLLGFALRGEGSMVYVANQGIDKIQVVDTDAKKVVKEIEVTKTPHNILFFSR